MLVNDYPCYSLVIATSDEISDAGVLEYSGLIDQLELTYSMTKTWDTVSARPRYI